MKTFGDVPTRRDTAFNVLRSRSNINKTYLKHPHFIGPVPLEPI